MDPSSSKFIWRVKSADGNTETVSRISYTYWRSGEPNNSHGDEECILFYKDYYDGKWNDYTCTDLHCAICEVDI